MGLYILLGILGVLAAVLFIPVTVYVRYDGDFFAKVGYPFFRYPIYPPKSDAKAAEKPKAALIKAKEKKTKTTKQRKGSAADRLFEMLALVVDTIEPLWLQMGFLFRHVRLDDIILHLRVGGDDAAEAGIRYGKMQRNLWAGYAFLQHVFTVGRCDVRLCPEFLGREEAVFLSGKIRLAPWVVLAAALRLGVPFLWRLLFPKVKNPRRAV